MLRCKLLVNEENRDRRTTGLSLTLRNESVGRWNAQETGDEGRDSEEEKIPVEA
jgi:hypothetical protein